MMAAEEKGDLAGAQWMEREASEETGGGEEPGRGCPTDVGRTDDSFIRWKSHHLMCTRGVYNVPLREMLFFETLFLPGCVIV